VLFPLAGKPNTELEVELLGTASKSPLKQKIHFPNQLNKQEYYFKDTAIPNFIHVVDAPQIMEKEPNNNSKESQSIDLEPPFVVHGVIDTEDDNDDFGFKVKKDQKYEVLLYARAYGSSLDGHITIFNEEFKQLANNDDKDGADSRASFKADKDGIHHVRIKDYLNTYSPHHVYAVEVRPELPSVSATIFTSERQTQTLQSVYVPKGGRFATLMNAERVNHKTDLSLQLTDLPEGISFNAKPIQANVSKAPVVFYSDKDKSHLGFKQAQVKIDSTDPKQPLSGGFAQLVELSYGDPNNAVHFDCTLDKLNVAVVESVPFKVDVKSFSTPIVRFGSKSITVNVQRNEGFTEDIQLKLLMEIPGVGATLETKVSKDQTEGQFYLNANDAAALGKWPCAILASAKIKGEEVYTSTDLFELDVSEPYLMANIDMAAVSQGTDVDLSCNFEQRKSFSGNAQVRLVGLPGKASTENINIDKTTKEAFFKVHTDKETPRGQHKSLFVSVTIMENGEPIVHNIGGGGTLRVDPPPKVEPPKTEADKNAPPAPKHKSRLEQLREQMLAKKD